MSGLDLTTTRRLGPALDQGYSPLTFGPGEPHVPRRDLGGDPFALTDPGSTVLLRILHLTDMHVMDAGSPSRSDWIEARAHDPKWRPLLHMARTYDTLANWGVAALVAAARTDGGDRIELAIATGDNIDNAQRNELDAYLALLDGGTFSLPYQGPQRASWADDMRTDGLRADGLWPFWVPDGGANDRWTVTHGFPTVPGLLDAAGSPCTSAGIGIPWLSVLGNHDVMRQGTVYSDPRQEAIATGAWRAADGRPGFDPDDPFAAYMADPVAFTDGAPRLPVPADPNRRSITRAEFIRAHSGSHGFSAADEEPSGDYVFDTEHVRVVVLDTNHPTGHYQGSIGLSQLAWLDDALTAANGRPVLVVSHHGQVAMDNVYGNDPSSDRRLGDAMAEVLHRHANVIGWLVGHRHVHRIRAAHDPEGRTAGFWEITTSSTIDWPNQARIVEVIRGSDGSVGLRTTVVGHGLTDTSRDADPAARLAALHQEAAFNSSRVLGATHREGEPSDRNAVLPRPS